MGEDQQSGLRVFLMPFQILALTPTNFLDDLQCRVKPNDSATAPAKRSRLATLAGFFHGAWLRARALITMLYLTVLLLLLLLLVAVALIAGLIFGAWFVIHFLLRHAPGQRKRQNGGKQDRIRAD